MSRRRLMLAMLALAILVGFGVPDTFAKKGGSKPPEPPTEPPSDLEICYRPGGVGVALMAMNEDGGSRYEITPHSHFDASWSPDGAHVVFDSGPGTIWRVDVDGENETYLLDGCQPAWSPGGDEIAFCGDWWWTLDLMSADGSDAVTIHESGYGDDDWITSPTWNPDGTKIAFLEKADDTWSVRIYDFEADSGEEVTTITTLSGADDGTHIDWARTDDVLLYAVGGGVYTLDLDTGQSSYVTDGGGSVSWSPDDSQCVFNGDVEVPINKKKTKVESGIVKYTFSTGERVLLVGGTFADWMR